MSANAKPRRVKISQLTDHLKRKDPLEVEFDDGAVFRLTDPKSLQLRDQLALAKVSDDPAAGVRILLGDKAEEFLARDDVDGYLFESLIGQYNEHFGFDPGESTASLPS